MQASLVEQWSEYFELKLKSNFNIDPRESMNYHLDAAPLVYSCLLHRRVSLRKRKIFLSKEFKSSKACESKEWLNLKSIIEDGNDINEYMSKSLKGWSEIDYLLYTFKIHHIHLKKNKDGGINNELIFGVFTKTEFFVLGFGLHSDLYRPDKWFEILEANWPHSKLIKMVKSNNPIEEKFNAKFFKRLANDKRLQYNQITPLQLIGHKGASIVVCGHQHTVMIDFCLNHWLYKKIPFAVYCAYVNEAQYLENIETRLLFLYGINCSLKLQVNEIDELYRVNIRTKGLSIYMNIPFLKERVLVTTYYKENHYPYV